jgi:predicted nucleotidyltransferase
MTTPERQIVDRLAGIELEHRVRILYACESGSRAWGFASPDSDWDVRFLYVHPLDWYLSVDERRDVIELPIADELDINGWELRKALRLMRKSNPVLLEWLHSPLCYRRDEGFLTELRRLAIESYSPAACFHHYLHMARGNWREYLHGPTVKLKKYLYVLRPVLACRWIEAGGGVVPVEFGTLVAAQVTDVPLRQAIDGLLARKQATGELGAGPAIPEIDSFLAAEIERLSAVAASLPPARTENGDDLNRLLRSCVSSMP